MMKLRNCGLAVLFAAGSLVATSASTQAQNMRVSSSTKGSLLIYSKVDLRWNSDGDLIQDTILELTNDLNRDVNIQMYFVNGDAPVAELRGGSPNNLILRAREPGWNFVDFQTVLTANQPIYWSAATGEPLGSAGFDILDPDEGDGPGRPDTALDNIGGRVLRGFIYLWAIDADGAQISWNHLSGSATIINYDAQNAWEYNAWAFQTVVNDPGAPAGTPGSIDLNGISYAKPYDMLLMDFYASGSTALSSDVWTVSVDTDLTLHPVSVDFVVSDSSRPVNTMAHFDIWNENERGFSGTKRCITCWDQTLLSDYGSPKTFLKGNLKTDKGKARIDGVQDDRCDDGFCESGVQTLGCSQDAALLGVVAKELAFSGVLARTARSGRNLVGMGTENAFIDYAIARPPGTLRTDAYDRIGQLVPVTGDDTRTFESSKRGDKGLRTSSPR